MVVRLFKLYTKDIDIQVYIVSYKLQDDSRTNINCLNTKIFSNCWNTEYVLVCGKRDGGISVKGNNLLYKFIFYSILINMNFIHFFVGCACYCTQ